MVSLNCLFARISQLAEDGIIAKHDSDKLYFVDVAMVKPSSTVN